VYVLVRNVSGLTPGVYRYRPALHDLESVVPRASLAELAVNPPSLGAAAAVFLLAATPARSQIKYRERGYRLVLLEAGHVAQNLHLAAVAQGLRSCCVAGFLDEPARRLVGERDGSGTDVIYLVAVGR
jgi:SagB-type dehydrogenase family enzyme